MSAAMSPPGAARGIAFMACPLEDLEILASRLKREWPDTTWNLICFYQPPEFPWQGQISVSRRPFQLAVVTWLRSLVGRYDRAIVCCHEIAQPSALQSLLLFVSSLRVAERTLIDRNGNRRTIDQADPLALVSFAAMPAVLAVARMVTQAGLAFLGEPRTRRQPLPQGPVALVVPILPDLSHTFVYREVLALKHRHPELLIVNLERGDMSVIHAEAAELLALAEAVPALSPFRYVIWYLAAWCRRPIAMASLVRFFRPHTALFGPGARHDDPFCFLRLEHQYHSNYLMAGFVLAEFLRRRRVSYVHVWGSTYPALRTLVAHRWLGMPYSVSTFVDFDCVTPFHLLREKFEPARFVVTCTEFCARRLAERLPEGNLRLRVLHHALPARYGDHPRFRPRDGRSRLIYVGRLVAKKGMDTLVRACAVLRQRGVDFTCHIYGAGVEREALQRLVAALDLGASVVFEGPIPNERFYEIMNRDDVFVCASRYEADGERDGIPVALMEAMAAGITVVATTVSGIPELIEDGANGYLVAPDNPERLAELLGHLLQDPGRRQAVAEPAARTIRERFSLERTSTVLDGWISQETSSAVETSGRAARRVSETV